MNLRPTELAGFPALESGQSTWPPLLFLHGSFATHECFRQWVGFFAERGWRAISASRRGRLHLPPARAEGLELAQYLDDTRRMIDALGTAPVLIGHSGGGLLAQKLAEEGRCAAAALLSPAPPWMLLPSFDALPALLPLLPNIMAGRSVLPNYWTAVRTLLNRVPQPDRSRIHAALVHESGVAFRQLMHGSLPVDASKVSSPMRVVGADDDRIIAPRLARRIADCYGAAFDLRPGHGHWLIEEPGWEAIATAVADWLDAVVPRAARLAKRPKRASAGRGGD
jgi:pimeloyl-ACP methyl ester carboxylesterase